MPTQEVAFIHAATAEGLWQLLDDIDTADDIIKPHDLESHRAFRSRVLDFAKRRHGFLKSDGHKLTWPGAVQEPAPKSAYTFESIPEYAPLLADKYEDLKLGIEASVAGAGFQSRYALDHGNLLSGISALYADSLATLPPMELLLSCPVCHARHIDVGEFAKKPHHTHACQGCGNVWRPAKEPTVGVQYLSGYKNAPTGQELVGKRVRVLTPHSPLFGPEPPLGATHFVTRFDGPYFNANEERYHVSMGTGELRLRRDEFEAL